MSPDLLTAAELHDWLTEAVAFTVEIGGHAYPAELAAIRRTQSSGTAPTTAVELKLVAPGAAQAAGGSTIPDWLQPKA